MEFSILAASEGGAPWWLVVLTATLGLIGGLAGSAIPEVGARFVRRDKLKSYRRNIYRNFLDHGYSS